MEDICEDEFNEFRELINGIKEDNERHNKLIDSLRIAKNNCYNIEVAKQINETIKQANEKFVETGNFKKLEAALQRYVVCCSLDKWEKVKDKVKKVFKDVKNLNVETVFMESSDYMLRIIESSNVISREHEDIECGGWIVNAMIRLYLDTYIQPGAYVGASFKYKFVENKSTPKKSPNNSTPKKTPNKSTPKKSTETSEVTTPDPKTSTKRKKTIFESSDESSDSEESNNTEVEKNNDDEKIDDVNSVLPKKKRKKEMLIMKTGACSVEISIHVEDILKKNISSTYEEIIETLRDKIKKGEIKKLESNPKFKFYVTNLKNKMKRESMQMINQR